MATTRRMSLNTGTPPERKPKVPKAPKEKGYQVPAKYNRNGTEYGAKRRGNIQQFDRSNDARDQKFVTEVPIKGSYNASGFPSMQKVKTRLGGSDYPEIIQKTEGQYDLSKSKAHNQGVAQQVSAARQAGEDEKMDKVRKLYSKGYQTTSGGKARGTGTYLKYTSENKLSPTGKKSEFDIKNDREYAANKRFSKKIPKNERTTLKGVGDKRNTRNEEQAVYRKNLLGRNVTVTKNAQFGAVTKGSGTKSKQIGDKIITRTRSVTDSGGIPFLLGKNARKYGKRAKQVDRVGTSTKKGFAASGDTRGVVTNSRLGYTGTSEDVKTKKFASHRRVGKR
jgi:hypothetical protein